MKYIAHKRFKEKSLSGYVNIPALSKLELKNGALYFDDKVICLEASENAHDYFACDNDDNGISRGNFTRKIKKMLATEDADYQNRWNKIWGDDICKKYKRADYEDYWLWNHDFYNAPLDDLEHIWNLIRGI